MGPTITVANKVYKHVKTREYTPVSVYKGGKEFLRIGPRDLIAAELSLHKKLLIFGFPVPDLISEGEFHGQLYYIEQSLGETLLGDLFWEDWKHSGAISNAHFESFLVVSERFALAQLKTSSRNEFVQSFYLGIHVDVIQEELPEIQSEVLSAFDKLNQRTSVFPNVLTHGDFNPYNLFARGIIDFGDTYQAPAGYDVINNIYHTYNFPSPGDFESTRRYTFTQEQIVKYFASMDQIYTSANLPGLSHFQDDFVFAKTIWSVVRMERWPKVQRWRYERFKQILHRYLRDELILPMVLSYR